MLIPNFNIKSDIDLEYLIFVIIHSFDKIIRPDRYKTFLILKIRVF